MTQPIEFSRPVAIDTLGSDARQLEVTADPGECAALARRFDLPAIESLAASLGLTRDGDSILAEGRLRAQVTQSCVASAAPVAAAIDTPFRIRFSPETEAGRTEEEEIELSEADCDVVFYEGGEIDIGEAVAETLALSLDPWPRAPGADEVLRKAQVKSEAEAGPFAALAALKDKLGK